MKKVPIHWDALETAFERNAPDTESFLDVTSGQVITIVSGDPEAPALKARVAENIDNYVRVDPASSREQYRWMERFVTSVTDEQLRERLLIAIDGKGAFRRFKDVLLAFPSERERWFTYRSDLLHWHMQKWLEDRKIEPAAPPPWGEPKPPPELPEVPVRPNPVAAESPGEALRREARDLIDTLPAIELPTAIAFLEFLKERGAESLQPKPGAHSSKSPPARRQVSHDDGDDGGDDEDGRKRRAGRPAPVAASVER